MKHGFQRAVFAWVGFSMLGGCATTRPERSFLVGAGIGGIAGGVGGASLSPNNASRPWNGLIFGLSGALLGGLIGLYRASREDPPTSRDDGLAERERRSSSGALYAMPPEGLGKELPPYVKERISNLVIEEETSRDEIGEDGSLHEPHRVFRIRQQPELLSKDSATTKPAESSQGDAK